MYKTPHDRQIVEAFVRHLRDSGMPGLKVDVWLEDAFPGTSQVEAIVGPFAVEHTGCDTFHNQRAAADWFDETVTPIEELLAAAMPGYIRIYLPVEAVSRGKDWSALRNALAVWLATDAAAFPDGHSEAVVPGANLTVRQRIEMQNARLDVGGNGGHKSVAAITEMNVHGR